MFHFYFEERKDIRMLKLLESKLKLMSNVTFWIGILLAIYGIVNIYLVRKDLPPGVCPIVDNRPWLYAAICFMVVSILLSHFETKRNKGLKDE